MESLTNNYKVNTLVATTHVEKLNFSSRLSCLSHAPYNLQPPLFLQNAHYPVVVITLLNFFTL